MSINRFNPKRDANEKAIVDLFKAHQLSVARLNTPLDLLVGWKKVNYLVEIKIPGKWLNSNQEAFVLDWKGQFIVIDSIEQAEKFIKGVKE